MATSRIDMRVDETIKAAAEKAAALEGVKSLTEYVVRLIEKDSQRVIKEHESTTLKDDVFDRFIRACDAAQAPAQKLRGGQGACQAEEYSVTPSFQFVELDKAVHDRKSFDCGVEELNLFLQQFASRHRASRYQYDDGVCPPKRTKLISAPTTRCPIPRSNDRRYRSQSQRSYLIIRFQ